METLRILVAEDHPLFRKGMISLLSSLCPSDREREILNLIAQGHPNPAIAKQLSLSTKTVGNCVSNIFTKLQVARRA